MRHLRLRELWIQEKVRSGELEIEKIAGEENEADLFTEPLAPARHAELCKMIGVEEFEEEQTAGMDSLEKAQLQSAILESKLETTQ